MGWFTPEFMGNIALNVFGILRNDLLLAIPFFTLMGAILEKCGAGRHAGRHGQLFGPHPAAWATPSSSWVHPGAITGTVAGQVIAMAMIRCR